MMIRKESRWERKAIDIEKGKLRVNHNDDDDDDQKGESLGEEVLDRDRVISRLSDYYIEYGELLKKMGEFEEIQSVYQRGIELERGRSVDSDDGHIDEAKTAKYYYLYARFFRDDERDYLRSEMYYKKCLQIDARYDGANGSYGHLLYLMGNLVESRKYLNIARKLDERNLWTFYYYGLLMNELLKYEEAEQSLNRSLEMFQINCRGNAKNAGILRQNMRPHLAKTKAVDAKHLKFHQRFEVMIDEYVETLRREKSVDDGRKEM